MHVHVQGGVRVYVSREPEARPLGWLALKICIHVAYCYTCIHVHVHVHVHVQ